EGGERGGREGGERGGREGGERGGREGGERGGREGGERGGREGGERGDRDRSRDRGDRERGAARFADRGSAEPSPLAAAVDAGGLGIGHDCAVLRLRAGESLAWHVDDQVEDVHFRRRWASFEDVGWKAAAAALSDLAAVGARPLGAQLALELPRDLEDRSALE